MFLVEGVVAIEVVAQVASVEVVHQQIEVLPVLEGALHVHDELAVPLQKLGEDLPLVHH